MSWMPGGSSSLNNKNNNIMTHFSKTARDTIVYIIKVYNGIIQLSEEKGTDED